MDAGGPTVQDLLRIAREDIARNRLSAAEKTLEQTILMNNQSPEAFYQLGCVYFKKGKFKKAMHAFQRTLEMDSTHTEASIALSSLYNDVGKYKEGANVYFKAKKRLEATAPGFDPRINEAIAQKHYEVGMLYLQFERFSEAHDEFTKAMRLQPENIKISVQLAKTLARTGQKDKALQFLRRILEDNPSNPEVRIQIGILYHSENRLSDARREWEEALAVDPQNKTARMYLSMFDYDTRMGGFTVPTRNPPQIFP